MNANLDIVPMQDWIQTNGKPLIIAGPCSAETEEQVFKHDQVQGLYNQTTQEN